MNDSELMQPPGKSDAKAWVRYLSQVEMPALAETLREISQLTDSDNSTVNQLAEVILKDAELTTQVLRLSNTVFYNRSRLSVSTVSRAITLIGFDAVQAMAISSLVVDSLLTRNPRTHLLRCLARSLHAAVQARYLAPGSDSEKKEELFVGALLGNIGEMVFWACRTPQADELDRMMNQVEPVEAQKEVLGTTFVDISRGLVQAWSLGRFVKEVVAPGRPNSQGAELVRHAMSLAEAAEKGWEDQGVERTLGALARQLKVDAGELRDQIRSNSQEAAQVAVSYGMPQVTVMLPGDGDSEESHDGQLDSHGDPLLQLQILRELSALLVEKPDINLVFQTVVEGVHRAVGMQRVVLLMKDRTGKRLITRKVLGDGTAHWREDFFVDLTANDLLNKAVSQGEPLLLDQPREKPWKNLEPPTFDRHIGRRTGMFGPLLVSGRVVGLLYADNSDLFRAPGNEQFQAFCHFLQQAQLCLNNLAENS